MRCKVDKPCYNQEEPSLKKGYLKKLEANICGKCLTGLGTGFKKKDFMLWLSCPWNCHGTNIFFFLTNQNCFNIFTHKESVMKSLTTGKQDTWETSENATAAAVVVPDGLETPVFVTEIAQSSGKQSFDQLQSCSRQLEHLNNWLQEGVRNRLVGQVCCSRIFCEKPTVDWKTCQMFHYFHS